MVDLDATLDQEFFDVAIRQALAEVPAHRQHDDVGWGTEADEGRAGGWSRMRAASSHAGVWLPEGGHPERNSAAIARKLAMGSCEGCSRPGDVWQVAASFAVEDMLFSPRIAWAGGERVCRSGKAFTG
jgi:hypothetical protein